MTLSFFATQIAKTMVRTSTMKPINPPMMLPSSSCVFLHLGRSALCRRSSLGGGAAAAEDVRVELLPRPAPVALVDQGGADRDQHEREAEVHAPFPTKGRFVFFASRTPITIPTSTAPTCSILISAHLGREAPLALVEQDEDDEADQDEAGCRVVVADRDPADPDLT